MDANLIATLMESYAALHAEPRRQPGVPCSAPTVSEHDLSVLESTVQVMQDDVAAALQGLGQLVSNYPRGIGDEAEILPKLGSMLRVMGDALAVANDSGTAVSNQQWIHEQIRTKSPESITGGCHE
ncbi:hypothetical protein [Paludibacterium denitrificans]|uniref:Uncharacterized protein n=1 Tax=Paludibacterium denitrificans TaxID=2675226 RepID=A0A844GC77_9NEIS|nr:hypothetical protein [Paludibacterium denitrificans]MTD33249.1 hypothetical protein [Paludibacterium denitrificans]